jgi:hypothetical protein
MGMVRLGLLSRCPCDTLDFQVILRLHWDLTYEQNCLLATNSLVRI